MTVPFDKTITVYSRDNDNKWQRTVITGVYYGLENKTVSSDNGNKNTPSRTVIVPTEKPVINTGDYVILGNIIIPELTDAKSGNMIIANGGWLVRYVENNIYPGCRLSNLKVSEV